MSNEEITGILEQGEVDAQHRLPEPVSDEPTVQTAADLGARISQRAFELWLAEGQPADSAEHDWMLAEQQVLAEASSTR